METCQGMIVEVFQGCQKKLRISSGVDEMPEFGAPRNRYFNRVQTQVDEVIDVMQENITKVIERGERLDELQDKSESLSDNASAFSSRAKQLHRRMWWRDCKMKAIIALVVVIVLLIIIVPVILKYH
ncbi:vesicle-associated membrane protein 4 isoform X2 [Lepisosteus oculatus]|uniref:vesicle-associated membrane protein 4 isoform X2 n=1 Tax=Lepisosteus oculatus TaxID=7918 RepID=UPI00371961BA